MEGRRKWWRALVSSPISLVWSAGVFTGDACMVEAGLLNALGEGRLEEKSL